MEKVDSNFKPIIITLHILTPIILACIVNAVIYVYGWNSKGVQNKFLPPGYVIAIVWVIILGLLGYSHYLVYQSVASWVIVIAIIYCLAYPFLTSGLENTQKSSIYNMLAFIISLIVFIVVFNKDMMASLYTLPLLMWSFYVFIVTNI